ncbi:MAG TPA: hypothetical protein DCZ72_06750 [Armatimonadetes bacterium]|nr:hypothetical protein [Armatimonadota bacterium]
MPNIVLIGLRGHENICLDAIARRDDAQLVAVWESDPAALDRARQRPGVTEATLLTPNLDEILARRDVQVAILAEDNGSRAGHLIECFNRGWHVFAEKPLAITSRDLDQVRAAHAAAGTRLSMLLTMRYEPIYRSLRAALAEGLIGAPLQLSAQKSYKLGQRPAWQRDPASYGATIPFIGIHPVDLLRYVTGCDYQRVSALARSAGLPGSETMDESCALLLETTEGLPTAIRLDFLRPAGAPTHGDDRIRVAGERGVLEVLGGRLSLLTPDAPPQELPITATAPNMFDEYLDELAGVGTHELTAADCLRATELVLAAQQAAVEGRWVDCAP